MKNLFETTYNTEAINALAGRYIGYTKCMPKEIVYHDPENEDQLEKAKAVRKRPLTAFLVITVLFLITAISSAVTGSASYIIAIGIICTLVLAIMTLRLMFQKVQVTTGRVVMKYCAHKIGRKKQTFYYVTAAIDYPEKIICSFIIISKADYGKVDEGTPILLVNALGSCYACLL